MTLGCTTQKLQMETIYIETTIVSYLVANPSRDLILIAHQEFTREWWREERGRYRCVTSEEVIREVSLKGLRTFMAGRGLVLPEICTPIDLAGD
jgi:hypothetical protein